MLVCVCVCMIYLHAHPCWIRSGGSGIGNKLRRVRGHYVVWLNTAHRSLFILCKVKSNTFQGRFSISGVRFLFFESRLIFHWKRTIMLLKICVLGSWTYRFWKFHYSGMCFPPRSLGFRYWDRTVFNVMCPVQYCVQTLQCPISMLSSMGATSHMWLLNIWIVTNETKQVDFKFT